MEEEVILNKIKTIIASHRSSSKLLAKYLQLSIQTVSKWNTNKVQPSLFDLYRIAAYYNINVHELIHETKPHEGESQAEKDRKESKKAPAKKVAAKKKKSRK